MQQPPPGGRPGPPYQPPGGNPPGGRPPGTPGAPYNPQQYAQPQYAQPQQATPSYVAPPPPRKKRTALRMVAGSCVFSAWLTLVVSILFAIGSFLAGASAAATAANSAAAASRMIPTPSPTQPGAGLEDLGLGGGGGSPLGNPLAGAGLSWFTSLIAPICFASGAFTLVSGIVGFILLLGLAQACYVLMDLEDQSYNQSLTLQAIVARLGTMR